jgi:hypothetical protein
MRRIAHALFAEAVVVAIFVGIAKLSDETAGGRSASRPVVPSERR